MKYHLYALLLLSLTACSEEPHSVAKATEIVPLVAETKPVIRPVQVWPSMTRQTSDGFLFNGKQYTLDSVNIKMVYYNHLTKISKACKELGCGAPHVQGFAYIRDGKCEIHVLDPSLSYEPHIAGHELLHCVHGKFHD